MTGDFLGAGLGWPPSDVRGYKEEGFASIQQSAIELPRRQGREDEVENKSRQLTTNT
jgi:hypothetical protein